MNIIICTTPFQMLIAENILELYKNEDFFLIVITPNKNIKYRYYYNKIKKKVKKSLYIRILPTHKFLFKKVFTVLDLFYLKLLGCFFGKMHYKKIFLANIESLRIHMFLSGFKNYDIYTFDDGTANVIQNSYFYIQEQIGILKKIFFKFMGNNLTLYKLKENTKQHFTIYKDLDNIIDNIYYINLFPLGCIVDGITKNMDEVRIFLGQPIYEFNLEAYEKISKYLDVYGIDYYFRHPREKRKYFKNVKYIETELLFEDYLLNFLKEDKKYIKIYSLYSGSLLNIVDFPNVEAISIYDKCLKDIDEIYSIFKKKNIKVIKGEYETKNGTSKC